MLRQREFHKCLYCGEPIPEAHRISESDVQAAREARAERIRERRAGESQRAAEKRAAEKRAAKRGTGLRSRYDFVHGTFSMGYVPDSGDGGG